MASYLRSVTRLARHYRRSTDRISAREVQDFLMFLQQHEGLHRATCNTILHGMRFFYRITLDRPDGTPDIDYPAFVVGERRCPPGDVGGAPGFMQFLEAALNPFHDEHEEVLTWYGKPFDLDDIASGTCAWRSPPSPTAVGAP